MLTRLKLSLIGCVAIMGCATESADPVSSTTDAVIPLPPWLLWPEGCASPTGIVDLGYPGFRVNADVNADGYPDYCRFVGSWPDVFLSCQLACPPGGYGIPYGFNSIVGIDQGYPGTQQMKDVNRDGRLDFCRTVGSPATPFEACDLAQDSGFSPDQYDAAGCTAEQYQLVQLWSIGNTTASRPTAVIGDPLNVNWYLQRRPQPAGTGPDLYLNGERFGTWFGDGGFAQGAKIGPTVTPSTPTHWDLVWPLPCGTREASIDVAILQPRMGTVTLGVDHPSITRGQTALLSYRLGIDVTDGSLCAPSAEIIGSSAATGRVTYDSGVSHFNGNQFTVSPSETTHYTLTAWCTNTPSLRGTAAVTVAVGPREATAAITMSPLPSAGPGYTPYVGSMLPVAGGTLERIANPSSPFAPVYVALVKTALGYDTTSCGDPAAVVAIGPGQSTTDIASIVQGGGSLSSGLALVACSSSTDSSGQPLPFLLDVTYTY